MRNLQSHRIVIMDLSDAKPVLLQHPVHLKNCFKGESLEERLKKIRSIKL